MTLDLSPPVATLSGAVEWLYESDTPTQMVERDAPLSIPFTVPSAGTVVVIYKPNTRSSGTSGRYRALDVYQVGTPDAVASAFTTSGSIDNDDANPFTFFAPVSEGEHYLQFSATSGLLKYEVTSIRVGHIPAA